MYMFSETSPDAFGMGDGKVDSGRALKLRLMRTIAKVARKRLYYDAALKEVLHTAQLLAKAWDLGVYNEDKDDYSLKLNNAEVPEIEWSDGLPIDETEAIANEQIRIESGNTPTVDSIMRLDRVDKDTALKKLAEIRGEQPTITLPGSNPKIDNEDEPSGEEEEQSGAPVNQKE